MAKPIKKRAPKRPPTGFEPKGYDPKRIWQKIKSENLFEALDLDPRAVPWMYLENIIIRSFSRILGQGPYGPVVAKCTGDGSLAVVSRGGAFDAYERQDYSFVISGAQRTTTGAQAFHLIHSLEDFPAQGIKAGDTVFNTTDNTIAYVTAVAIGDLTLDADIMAITETYKLYPCKDFTFSRQVERIDLFTYVGPVDYQMTRDAVQPLGSKIPLFEDSFYSLDFYTLRVRATTVKIPTTGSTRSSLFGWHRIEG